jgi:hypothetical protein
MPTRTNVGTKHRFGVNAKTGTDGLVWSKRPKDRNARWESRIRDAQKVRDAQKEPRDKNTMTCGKGALGPRVWAHYGSLEINRQ